jgi:hypothetical protein
MFLAHYEREKSEKWKILTLFRRISKSGTACQKLTIQKVIPP